MKPRVRVVLQARMSSSRLPGKAMMPIAGIPMVILAALRAGNQGHEVLVATSDATSDDAIADACETRGVRVVRGPLDDVLGRFLIASEDLDDADIVVRLTADNVVPVTLQNTGDAPLTACRCSSPQAAPCGSYWRRAATWRPWKHLAQKLRRIRASWSRRW